jgi:hypothetical protein
MAISVPEPPIGAVEEVSPTTTYPVLFGSRTTKAVDDPRAAHRFSWTFQMALYGWFT